MLEVILTREVETLGDRGDIVRVAPGYARNFLYPKQMALPATAANKKQIEEMRAAATKRAKRLIGEAEEIAEQMQDLTVRVVARAGATNVLFGSVTSRDIAEKLAEKGFPVDRHKIVLDKPLKEVNDYDVRVHLYRDVNVHVKVEVRAEGREDEPLVTPEERAAAAQADADAFEAAQLAAEAAAAGETPEGEEAAEGEETAETAEASAEETAEAAAEETEAEPFEAEEEAAEEEAAKS